MSFKLYRNALQKMLNETCGPRTMKHLVRIIHVKNCIYFTKDELDVGGTSHNKPLYITVKCKDCTVDKVLVNSGSILNALPKHVLDEMLVDSIYILPNTMTTRAYDGSRRQVTRTIEIELFIDLQVFLITLQVMDIQLSYNMLLERPRYMLLEHHCINV
jgi:hypothetical protein